MEISEHTYPKYCCQTSLPSSQEDEMRTTSCSISHDIGLGVEKLLNRVVRANLQLLFSPSSSPS